MSKFRKSFHIKGRDFIRAGEAAINIQNLLKSMDFDPRLVRRVAICGYESEMNVVMHGGEGSLSLEVDAEQGTQVRQSTAVPPYRPTDHVARPCGGRRPKL